MDAFAHVLSMLPHYPERHPLRERALDAAYEALEQLMRLDSSVFGPLAVRALDRVVEARSSDPELRLAAQAGGP